MSNIVVTIVHVYVTLVSNIVHVHVTLVSDIVHVHVDRDRGGMRRGIYIHTHTHRYV